MKKIYLLAVMAALFISYQGIAQNRYWISTVSSNWNNSANWSTASGGTGGASVPGSGNVAIFDGAGGRTGTCVLDISPTVGGMSMITNYTGTIDLNGNILTTTGTNNFAVGTVSNSGATGSLTLNTAGLTTFQGTQFTATVNGSSGRVLFSGSVFTADIDITKSGATNDNGTGGNTFGGAVTLTNTGSGQLQLGGTSPDTFNGAVTINSNSTAAIMIARASAGNILNGSVSINYNSTGSVIFGYNGGSSTLAAGQTISVASYGASGCGNLQLSSFTQAGGTSQSLILAGNGTATLTLGPSSVFNGALTTSSPVLIFNSSTFNNTGTFTQTSDSNTGNSRGGNLFMGVTDFTNTGDADLVLGSNSADAGDTFQADATFHALGGGRIRVGQSSAGTVFNANATFYSSGDPTVDANRVQVSRLTGSSVTFNGTTSFTSDGNTSDVHISYDAGTLTTFNGPVIFTSSSSNNGEFFVGNLGDVIFNNNVTINSTTSAGIDMAAGTGTVTMMPGYTITVGAAGFSAGTFQLSNFTQNGTTPVSLTFTGNAILQVGPGSSIGGDVTFASPRVRLHGCTYGGSAYIEKTGATDDASNGGNTFSGTATIVNSGSGYFLLANTTADTFSGDLTVTNSGSNLIYLAHNSGPNNFNGNIILNASSGTGIYFSNNTAGSSVLAAGKSVSIGATGFTSGELRFRRFTQLGTAASTLALGGASSILRVGSSTTFGGDVNFKAPQLLLDGATYNGTTNYLEKTGANGNTGLGGNIFSGNTTIVNSGSSFLYTNGSNTFNGPATLLSTGNQILLEYTSGSVYNSDLTLINNGTSSIRMAYAGSTTFSGNVSVSNTTGTAIYFAETNGATATLSDGYTIAVGAGGFSSGELRLSRFTQVGNTAQTLALTGTALLRVGPTSTFNGNVDFRSPQLYLDGASYNGAAYLEKTGATANIGTGANVFGGTTTIVNSGSGYLRTNGDNIFNGVTSIINSGSADILLERYSGGTYNNDVTFTNTGSSSIRIGYLGTNTFGGNIVVNSTGGTGIFFCESTGTATLADTKTISVGSSGLTTGRLSLIHFTQLGTTPQSLTLTGTSSLYLGPTSTFNGNVNFKAPRLFLNGCTYNGVTLLEKTGATNDDSNGSNIFNGVTTLTNSGSGWLRSGVTTLDSFNNDLTLNNNSTASYILLSDNVAGTVYNGNITVNATSGSGVYFGSNGGTSTLAAGKTIAIGASGFTSGELRLARFTQTGSTAQTLNVASILRVGPASSFDGNVDFKGSQLYLDGCSYNGATTLLEKYGATNNTGLGNNTFGGSAIITNSSSAQLYTNGNNTFNGTATLISSGSSTILLELLSASTYNGDVTLTNTGTGYIRSAFSGSNAFNGNIAVNSTSGTGVYFCENTSGSATLASGKTISVGATGFTTGTLWMQRFTQAGSTAQNVILTGSALLQLGPTVQFNGDVTATSPQVLLNGATFNGAATVQKNGVTTNTSSGGNTFNGTTVLINNSTAQWLLANGTGDTYNGAVTFSKLSSGAFLPAYNQTNNFAGDITINSTTTLTLGGGTGIIQTTGSNAQAISKTAGSVTPVFQRLVMNKTSNTVTLNTDISIGASATFTSGILNSSSTALLLFPAGTSVSGANNNSYVNGPVRKTGTTAFTFPVGAGNYYRPISIAAPAASSQFTAQYFLTGQTYGGKATWDPSFYTVSGCEYWILDRAAGGSNVVVTLSWNENACGGAGYITNLADLRVARWNGTGWVSHGNGGASGSTSNGTIPTSAAVTSFSPFTLASTAPTNPLPITLEKFWAQDNGATALVNWIVDTEINNDYFTLERSSTGLDFEYITTIDGAGNSTIRKTYNFVDEEPYPGLSYYRLTQTDFDGKSASWITSLTRKGTADPAFTLYPNPVGNETLYFNQKANVVIISSLDVIVMKADGVKNVDVSKLPAGVYLVKNQKGQVARFVKK